MPMKTLDTPRLTIRPLTEADAAFMLRLLNDASWLHYIGDRGVRTLEDAKHYILKGPVEMYGRLGFGFCAVELKASGEAPDELIGICGLAQRDYLDDPDIGFAFLPQFCGQGYAFESASAVLRFAQQDLGLSRVLATTRHYNQASQGLLEKLGLRCLREIDHPDGDRKLLLYGIEWS
ncbi:GNAT family N-acetyltransferase [Paucibacter sp. Y2R2-4]|uniref:GNAT family N-acetyltransferase n=1 Tax=Paucibacter sp. Y2R2-4 TaxID=2893553 RepID=UPI0021E4FB4A|nr:GNAT family N-acetyltransferase [Paucibacter sp. Y2R2-4]MCV2350415.1 GNAT family N-acetyltransferase [Paucibacter sp. Y2R2-4]